MRARYTKLGDRVDKGKVPILHRCRRADGEGRIWCAVLDRVLKRPVVSTVVAGGLLVALMIPAFAIHTNNPGLAGLPQDLKTRHPGAEEAEMPDPFDEVQGG